MARALHASPQERLPTIHVVRSGREQRTRTVPAFLQIAVDGVESRMFLKLCGAASQAARGPQPRRLLIVSALLVSALTAAVPTPESHFGHPIGVDRQLLDWSKVVTYF